MMNIGTHCICLKICLGQRGIDKNALHTYLQRIRTMVGQKESVS